MQRWWQWAVAALAGLLLGAAGAVLLGSGGDRFAVVDLNRIFKESKAGKDYQARLNERQQVILAELNKISNANERAARNQQYGQELAATTQEYSRQVVELADPIIARIAKKRGVSAVFTKDSLAIRYARIDLTEAVLKDMNK